ncbi:MAG: hypothetical protein VX738_10125 [Planctomycetota bacterium]|nr:hypothetical protein [Planctomycetota bacterium]
MRFRTSKEIQDDGSGKRRPPPNYFSRRVQYKLFALVALLMTVVVLMDQVRNPEMFRFFNETTANPQSSNPDRVPNPLFDPQLALFGQPKLSSADQAAIDLQATHKDLWTSILKKLRSTEQTTFVDTLRRARNQLPLDDAQKTQWWDLYQKIDLIYQQYEQQVMLSINSTANALTQPQRTRGQAVLVQLRNRWTQHLRKAFLDILETPSHAEKFQDDYIFVQNIIDQIALERIDDHTVFRNEDNLAWFRMLEKLGDHDEKVIRASSTARPNILELSEQQTRFRGTLISVRGEIRKAYRVQAHDNAQGIPQYFVLVLKPAGSELHPFIVYCLHPPANFPELPDKDLDGRTEEIGDLVDVTGYFFKSWAHLGGQGQMFSSPLVVAQTFQWLPGTKLAAQPPPSEATEFPLWAILTIPLILAVGFTVTVYWMSRWKSEHSRTQPVHDVKQQLAAIDDEQVSPSTSDALQQLADQLSTPTKSVESS